MRAAAVKRSIERGVDALIVWGVGTEDPEGATILESGLPAVFIDHDPIGARIGYVISANVEAMGNVVHHLYENGRRRIAHITGQSNTRPGPDRLLGYRSELAKLGLPARPEYIDSRKATTSTAAATRALSACSLCPSRPTLLPAPAT